MSDKSFRWEETRMTRDECELKIFKIVKELDSVIREYNPTNNHFSLFMDIDGFVHFNNIYWHPKDGEDGTTDEKRPIEASGNIKGTIVRFAYCAEIPKPQTNWDAFQQRYGTEKIDVNDAITKFTYSHMRCDFCPAKHQCGNLHTGELKACVDTFKAWATAEYKETK